MNSWIPFISIILSIGAFGLNFYGTRQKTIREGREDTRTRIQDLEKRVAECEDRHRKRDEREAIRDEELSQLRLDNYKLLKKLNS